MRWIPGHRQLSDARDAQQRTNILRNNEVDWLAKLATTYPCHSSRTSPLATRQTHGATALSGSRCTMIEEMAGIVYGGDIQSIRTDH